MIPAITPHADNPSELPLGIRWEETIRDLAASFGGTETYNYSFGNEDFRQLVSWPQSPWPRLALSNPPSPSQQYLRETLLPQLLEHLLRNKAALRRKTSSPERALFEIGSIFTAHDSGRIPGVTETKHFGLVGSGASGSVAFMRNLLDQIFQVMGITGVAFIASDPANGCWHNDYQSLEFSGQVVGAIGSLKPGSFVPRKLQQPVACVEINLSALVTHATLEPAFFPRLNDAVVQYEAPGKYPAVFRDISLVSEMPVSPDTVQAAIERLGGESLKDTELFDTYQNSLSFHLTLAASDHTLTDTEADQILRVITQGLKKELGLDIRE